MIVFEEANDSATYTFNRHELYQQEGGMHLILTIKNGIPSFIDKTTHTPLSKDTGVFDESKSFRLSDSAEMEEGITERETQSFSVEWTRKIFLVCPNDFLGAWLGPRNSCPRSETEGDNRSVLL